MPPSPSALSEVQPVVTYVALLRGVNVGGKNPVAMPALADCLAAEGLRDVLTYLQTGNAVFRARPAGDGVLYLATVMQAVTKSRLRNLISKPIYGDLTIRSFTTCERLLAMMQEISESRDPSGYLKDV